VEVEETAVVITCEYDALGRRIEKVDKTGSPDVTYDYYYNESWQMLEVRRTPAGGPEIVYKQYVWDIRYIDAPVLRWRDSDTDGTVDDTFYYTNDANMNVTAVVDTDGDVVERYAYDPYGRPIFVNGENGADPDVDGETVFEWQEDDDPYGDVDNCILYCGYLYDPKAGLYHVRYRTYHPTLGRWLQRDLAATTDGDLFGQNDWVERVMPSEISAQFNTSLTLAASRTTHQLAGGAAGEEYSDGMSLYGYVGQCPTGTRDPKGERRLNAEEAAAQTWWYPLHESCTHMDTLSIYEKRSYTVGWWIFKRTKTVCVKVCFYCHCGVEWRVYAGFAGKTKPTDKCPDPQAPTRECCDWARNPNYKNCCRCGHSIWENPKVAAGGVDMSAEFLKQWLLRCLKLFPAGHE